MKAVGGHVWIAGIVALALVSCTATDQPADPYLGAPARGTPYDGKYERVRLYLSEARARISYTPEQGNRDYWQLPEETETLGTGDCEDMAIWLYVKMKRNGLDTVRLCIGKHTAKAPLMHAWLIWFHGNNLYILDPSVSAKPIRRGKIRAGSYIPYYSYDGDLKWRHRDAG
ncbi:MAG: hypothetical protein HQ592_11600 [Planctomycetes bacterium]|nr:hypothetical protein [Planctomycetota bacterium]